MLEVFLYEVVVVTPSFRILNVRRPILYSLCTYRKDPVHLESMIVPPQVRGNN